MDTEKNYPLKIIDVEPDITKELMEYFTGQPLGFVRVGPKGYFLPDKFRQQAANIYHMPLRADDIFVASYPRSGTTWTQELVWMVANDLDYTKSNAISLIERYSLLECLTYMHPVTIERLKKENSHSQANLELLELATKPLIQQVARAPSPRFIKTHLPVSLLPPPLLTTAKMVYVARDPRDVAVSFYHMNRSYRILGYVGDFKTFWNYFVRDLVNRTPYFEHVKEAWEKRQHPNMLFLFYEELKKDLPAAVRRVAKFLNKEFTSEQISKLCDHLSIENFKNNNLFDYDFMNETGARVLGEPGFIRRGKAGGWRDYFDEELSAQAEQWIAQNLIDTDLRFPHL